MKVHLGKNLINNYYILVIDDAKFYWTKDTSGIICDKFETLLLYEYEKWKENWGKRGIQKIGYFDTDEYPSINAYKKDYPEFFI